jgi:hypothetical protein
MLLGDVESNNHNFVVALNKCVPPILAHFVPNCQDFSILLKLGMARNMGAQTKWDFVDNFNAQLENPHKAL